MRQKGRCDTSFGIGCAEKLIQGHKKVGTPRGVFRAEEKVFVSLDGAAVAAATVRGVTIMVAKKTPASGEKMVYPLGYDDTLVGGKTTEGGAMSGPVDRLPEAVGPLVPILEMSPKKGAK